MDIPFEDNSFDAVISNNAFAHISDVPRALEEVKRVLRPYGKFYTDFGGIWTSAAGHHWSKPTASGYWNYEYMSLIPPWGLCILRLMFKFQTSLLFRILPMPIKENLLQLFHMALAIGLSTHCSLSKTGAARQLPCVMATPLSKVQ